MASVSFRTDRELYSPRETATLNSQHKEAKIADEFQEYSTHMLEDLKSGRL